MAQRIRMSWGRTGVALGALLVACSSRVDVASHGEDVSNDGGGAVGTGGSSGAGPTGTGAHGGGGSTGGDGTGATGTGASGGGGSTGGDGAGAAGSTGFEGTGAAGPTGTGGSTYVIGPTDGGGMGTGGSTDVGGSTGFGGTGAAGSTGFDGTGSAGSTSFGGYTSGGDGGVLDCSQTPESSFLYQVDGRYTLFADYVGNTDGDGGIGVGIQAWNLLLRAGTNGAAVTDAVISVNYTMPLMGHPGPTVPTVTGGENGIYQVRNLGMSMVGYWRVAFTIQRPDGKPADTLDFNLCVVQHQ